MTSTPTEPRECLDGTVDPERGFLPPRDPLRELPAPFAHWDEVAADLPKLLPAERVRDAVHQLPELDARELPDLAVRRAMLVLSFIAHAYVYQSWREGVADCIPAALARPWFQVANR